MAYAMAQKEGDCILLHILWAGDSRVYILNDKGLSQITTDDTDSEDADANLTGDGVLTNVLSADGRYDIHCKTMRLRGPAMIFAASDGCFGYMPSPMHFEYEILEALNQADSPDQFKHNLYECFSSYAGDDFTFGMMSFMYGSFQAMKKAFKARLEAVKEAYIRPFEDDDSEEHLKALWLQYQPVYERLLKKRQ